MTSSKLRQPIPGLNIREAALPLPYHRGANSLPVGPAAYLQLLPYYRGANSLPVNPAAYLQPLVQRFNPPPPLINPAVLAQAIIQRYHPALRPASAPPSPFMEALAMRYYNDLQAAAATKDAQAAAATPAVSTDTLAQHYDRDTMIDDAHKAGIPRGFPLETAYNGVLDAFRHAVTGAWDTATPQLPGLLAADGATRMLGQANEIHHPAPTAQELTMDLFNNEVGIIVGRDALRQYQAGKFGTPGTEAATNAMKTYIADRVAGQVRSNVTINSTEFPRIAGQFGWFPPTGKQPSRASTPEPRWRLVPPQEPSHIPPAVTALSANLPPIVGGLLDNLGKELGQFRDDSAQHNAPTFRSGTGLLDIHLGQTRQNVGARGGYYNPSGVDKDYGRLPPLRSGPA